MSLARFDIDYDRPYVLFVGRMTRQKGLLYLLRAMDKYRSTSADRPVRWRVGYAGTAGRNWRRSFSELKLRRPGVIWIPEMVDRQTTIILVFARQRFLLSFDLRAVRHH